MSEGTAGDPDAALEQLAGAMRRISAVAVGHPIADDALGEATEALLRVADRLEAQAEERKRPRAQPHPATDPGRLFPCSPVIGTANPVAPPAYVWAVTGEGGQREIRGRVTFGYPYEGPPTCVHGGVIAELFDELLGSANIIANQPGMTGTLTVRYRKPTPLFAPLDLQARYTGSDGRKVYTSGAIFHDGELTAEAEGIFIAMPPGRMLDIVTTNAREAAVPVVDDEFIELIGEDPAG